MNWVEWTKSIGPFSAPLCLFMATFGGAVLRWVLKANSELLAELKVARDDATNLRERRIQDREEAAREYMAQGEATRAAIKEWTQTADAVLQAASRT